MGDVWSIANALDTPILSAEENRYLTLHNAVHELRSSKIVHAMLLRPDLFDGASVVNNAAKIMFQVDQIRARVPDDMLSIVFSDPRMSSETLHQVFRATTCSREASIIFKHVSPELAEEAIRTYSASTQELKELVTALSIADIDPLRKAMLTRMLLVNSAHKEHAQAIVHDVFTTAARSLRFEIMSNMMRAGIATPEDVCLAFAHMQAVDPLLLHYSFEEIGPQLFEDLTALGRQDLVVQMKALEAWTGLQVKFEGMGI
jgi:hypothetical protein